MPTPAETAEHTAQIIHPLGATYMFSEEVLAIGSHAGLDTFAFYVAGRCGHLGDVHADVVVSALAVFHPETAAAQWDAALAVRPAREIADLYRQGIVAWGRANLDGIAELDAFVEGGEAVLAATPPIANPLYAGWRTAERPEDPAGATALIVQILRELRFGVHTNTLGALGIDPLRSVIADSGSERAALFGWPEPHPNADDETTDLMQQADELTSARMADVYARVGEDERAALVTGIQAVRERLG